MARPERFELLTPRFLGDFLNKSFNRETGGGGKWFDTRDPTPCSYVAYFPTTPGMPKVCATSIRSTFPPLATCGCDGSKPSRNSRLNIQRTHHKEGIFQIFGPTKRSIEKGVAERIVAGIRSRERNELPKLPW